MKKTLSDTDIKNRRVLVRVDFNVPLTDGRISDDSRIRAVIPTIEYLRAQGSRVILCSHLGRPEGKIVPSMSLQPVALELSRLMEIEIGFVNDCIGANVSEAVSSLKDGEVLLLENLRFHIEEERNDSEFARQLSDLADVFVNDGFAVAHRAHASTEGITHYLPSVAGLLMHRELEILGTLLEHPQRPLVVLLGGAKVSDKIGVLENFINKVNVILIGGGMAATFLKAAGNSVGSSLVEDELVDLAKDISERARANQVELHIPLDVVVAQSFAPDSKNMTVDVNQVPDGWIIMDIGHKTLDTYRAAIANGRTILWNGPSGVFEFKAFSRGTRELAATMASLKDTITVVGGGSTAEAVESLGLGHLMTHVSTGGGASLEFLEGKHLPGIDALIDKE